jgi:hypothetical protein
MSEKDTEKTEQTEADFLKEDLARVEQIVRDVVNGDLENESDPASKENGPSEKELKEPQEKGKGESEEAAEKPPKEQKENGLYDENLDSEVDDCGNVEYKRQLVSPSPSRLQHLITQLKWRLGEGKVRHSPPTSPSSNHLAREAASYFSFQGEAIYEIGVDDDGTVRGLSPEDLAASLNTLQQMAKELSAETSVLCERQGKMGTAAQVCFGRG